MTAVERWVRDPYAIYARDILGLYPLERPDEPVEALARGSAVHAAFERFARDHPDALPDDAEAVFAALLLEELARRGHADGADDPRAGPGGQCRALGDRLRAPPAARRAAAGRDQGRVCLRHAGRPFTLTAKADRIEARGGVADILDFKTGAAPSAKQVSSGLAPQLTLTAAILAAGGFTTLGRMTPGELVYVRVNGGRTPGREELSRRAPAKAQRPGRRGPGRPRAAGRPLRQGGHAPIRPGRRRSSSACRAATTIIWPAFGNGMWWAKAGRTANDRRP